MSGDGCGCALCRAPLPSPAPLTRAEALARNRAYEDKRRRWRDEGPGRIITLDEIAAAGG